MLLSAALALTVTACGGHDTPPDDSASSTSSDSSSSSSSEETPVNVPFSLAIYPASSMHPVLTDNKANLTLSGLLYEPLFQLDASLQPVPVLCQSYTAGEDHLIWTFVLRSGITFSNGTPLTGSAVADALNLARQTGSRYAQRLRDITAITAGADSVTITLSRPNGNLPALLDIPIALGSGARPAGTGPYILSGGEDDLSLIPRTGWWKNTPLPAPKILLTAINQGEDLIASFASGGTALVDVDLMGTSTLGYSGNYGTWDYTTTDFLYLGFNTQRSIAQDPLVRQALSRAIDRDAIVQSDYARHAVSATLPVHPSNPLYDEELAQVLAYDSAAASAALTELHAAGHSVVFIVNAENTAKANAAARIAEQLEAAGIKVSLRKLTFDAYSAALASGSYDLYLGEVVLTGDFKDRKSVV